MKRRDFLQQTGFGLAAIGITGCVLRSDATPTLGTAVPHDAHALIETLPALPGNDPELKPTVSRDIGPFYRGGSPYRAKLTPPHEPGPVLVVTGRVWSFETKKPLPGVLLDLWQVDSQTATYSNGNGDFKNRARLLTDENGAYEFETVHPVPYSPGPNFWRSPHVHFIATAAGHKSLVSELFFRGDPKQDIDRLFHPSLSVPVIKEMVNGKEYETAVFDIVLETGK